jgi:hypothetical protein
MTSTIAPKAVAKKTALRKTAKVKKVAPAAAILEDKIAPARKKRVSAKRTAVSAIRPEERHHLIEIAAYYIAERRGFHGASSHDDWTQAEREVDAMIKAGEFTV